MKKRPIRHNKIWYRRRERKIIKETRRLVKEALRFTGEKNDNTK